MDYKNNIHISKKMLIIETIICIFVGIIISGLCWMFSNKYRNLIIGIDIGGIIVLSNAISLIFYPRDVDNKYIYLFLAVSTIINTLYIIFFKYGLIWADILVTVLVEALISFQYNAYISHLSLLNYNGMCNLYDKATEQSTNFDKKRSELIQKCDEMNHLIKENKEFYKQHTKKFSQILDKLNISKQLKIFHLGDIEYAEKKLYYMQIPQKERYNCYDLLEYKRKIKKFENDVNRAEKQIQVNQSIVDNITKNLKTEHTYLLTYSSKLNDNLPEETKTILSDHINEQIKERRTFFKIENIKKYKNEL